MSHNLIIRTIVAAIFGPLIIWISYRGGYPLAAMILLLSVIAMIEFLLQTGLTISSPLFWVTVLFNAAIAAISMLESPSWGMTLFAGYFLVAGIITVSRKEQPALLFKQNAALVWAMGYLALLYPFVYYLRNLNPEKGGDWLLFLFGTLWLSDTLAMWIGKTIGKRKLAPTISPNKTVAGYLGGLLGGVVIALIMSFWLLSDIIFLMLLIAGVAVAAVGQLGDLVESVWKRSVGVKDSSKIIPGHGGVLDRFDSLLFAAPVLYWILNYLIYG